MSDVMPVYREIVSYGFRISDDYIEGHRKNVTITDDKCYDFESLKLELLNSDMRATVKQKVGDTIVAKPSYKKYFPDNIASSNDNFTLKGPVVLQITTAVVNASNPTKHGHEDKVVSGSGDLRLLLLTLTDGFLVGNAVEFEPIVELHANLAPGTKVLYLGGDVENGKILLTAKNCKCIGGQVLNLYKNWLANSKTVSRTGNDRAPPPVFDFNLPTMISQAQQLVSSPVVVSSYSSISDTVTNKNHNMKKAYVNKDRQQRQHRVNDSGLISRDEKQRSSKSDNGGIGGRFRSKKDQYSDPNIKEQSQDIEATLAASELIKPADEASAVFVPSDFPDLPATAKKAVPIVSTDIGKGATAPCEDVFSRSLADFTVFKQKQIKKNSPSSTSTAVADKPWECSTCTFANSYLLTYCEICEQVRV